MYIIVDDDGDAREQLSRRELEDAICTRDNYSGGKGDRPWAGHRIAEVGYKVVGVDEPDGLTIADDPRSEGDTVAHQNHRGRSHLPGGRLGRSRRPDPLRKAGSPMRRTKNVLAPRGEAKEGPGQVADAAEARERGHPRWIPAIRGPRWPSGQPTRLAQAQASSACDARHETT